MVGLTGGAGLDAYLADLAKKVSDGAVLRVGYFEDATYQDGTSVAMVAAVNEFGAPSRGQPPRPSFRNMIEAKHEEWGPALAGLLDETGFDAGKALAILGEGIAGQLRQSVADFTSPPLAQSTIDRKGFDKPLIDTAVMINSIGYEVESASGTDRKKLPKVDYVRGALKPDAAP